MTVNSPEDPEAWLLGARSNLKLAEIGSERDVFMEDRCFEAQQAAEKRSNKNVLIMKEIVLKLNEFSQYHHPSKVTILAKYIEHQIDGKDSRIQLISNSLCTHKGGSQ